LQSEQIGKGSSTRGRSEPIIGKGGNPHGQGVGLGQVAKGKQWNRGGKSTR